MKMQGLIDAWGMFIIQSNILPLVFEMFKMIDIAIDSLTPLFTNYYYYYYYYYLGQGGILFISMHFDM